MHNIMSRPLLWQWSPSNALQLLCTWIKSFSSPHWKATWEGNIAVILRQEKQHHCLRNGKVFIKTEKHGNEWVSPSLGFYPERCWALSFQLEKLLSMLSYVHDSKLSTCMCAADQGWSVNQLAEMRQTETPKLRLSHTKSWYIKQTHKKTLWYPILTFFKFQLYDLLIRYTMGALLMASVL